MPKKFVGRESFYYGKTLFEIARNLKNFGAGRVVTRTLPNKKFPDGVNFYRLTKVEPDMNSKFFLHGKAEGQRVFRGVDYGIRSIGSGQKKDWILIPKEDEHLFTNQKIIDMKLKPKKVIPAREPVPPLMKLILKAEMEANGMKTEEADFYREVKTQKRSLTIKEYTPL